MWTARASITVFLLLFSLFLSLFLPFCPLFPSLYSESSPLHTSTKYYSNQRNHEDSSTYVPCYENCPWEHYMSNSEFRLKISFTDPFAMQDEARIADMKGRLACVPFSFGYDEKKGNAVFPKYIYPSCATRVIQPQAILSLDHSTHEFSMNCSSGDMQVYVLHPSSVPETSQYEYADMNRALIEEPYHGLLRNVSSEYAIGKCQDRFNAAVYIPKFKQEVYDRAQAIMAQHSPAGVQRPLILLFITVDSFSRHHFFRKMPQTIAYLNELNRGNFAVFDFKVSNIMGQGSPENMMPMFTNQSFSSHDPPLHPDQSGPYSLWSLFSSLGYVTFLGFEDCDHHFPIYMGLDLNIDHLIRSFYCAAVKYCSIYMTLDWNLQRCIGEYMSHYYTLNYTQTFTRMYAGVNQFIYLHLDAAHESSGQHAATLDTDLRDFLKGYLQEFYRNNDIVVFLQGDHGMRYGNWQHDIEAEQEHKLPVLFLIYPTRILDSLPYSYDSLWHNTHHLISKLDLRATILALSTYPYHTAYPVHGEKYLSKAKILHAEKIEDSRICHWMGIKPWLCSCLLAFQEIPESVVHSWGEGQLGGVLHRIAADALVYINGIEATTKRIRGGILCKKLSFDVIIEAYGAFISPKLEQLQLVFTVQESYQARIQVIALVGTDLISDFQASIPPYPAKEYSDYLSHPVYIQVSTRQLVSVSRKDAYAGFCEKIARAWEIEAEFCICNDLSELELNFPLITSR